MHAHCTVKVILVPCDQQTLYIRAPAWCLQMSVLLSLQASVCSQAALHWRKSEQLLPLYSTNST